MVVASEGEVGVEVGFVCRNCRFTAKDGVAEGSCFIALPWRDYAYVSIENCYLGEHINPAGFDDWGKAQAHETVRFYELDSYGPGAVGERPEYVKRK